MKYLTYGFGALLTGVFLMFALQSKTLAGNGPLALGNATWTSNLQQAQAQSAASGKPILMLDMIGQLDEKWC